MTLYRDVASSVQSTNPYLLKRIKKIKDPKLRKLRLRVNKAVHRGRAIKAFKAERAEFELLCNEYKDCPSCGVDMKMDASHIDFAKVRRDACEPCDLYDSDGDEIEFSSDPCDDCCCGACGSRKAYPGQCHC